MSDGPLAGVRVVDLSADFRLQDLAEWERWYKMKHAAPELVREAVYGLCELNRERIRRARLVANPGCYPTAIQLGFLPLVEAGVVDLDHLIADAKSGPESLTVAPGGVLIVGSASTPFIYKVRSGSTTAASSTGSPSRGASMRLNTIPPIIDG